MALPELPSPLPGGFGRRLLPNLVDEIASSNPRRPLYSIPRTANPADGFDDISVGTFARAVDRCAWFLHDTLGGSGWDKKKSFPTLSYMGPQDTMYAILTLAANKAGYKMLFNSPRNTLASHLDLFEKTGCDTFIMAPDFPLPAVKHILAARPMKVIEIPGQRIWFSDDGDNKPYPYTKTYDEARLDPFVVLHTSGSTGHPKAIVQKHGTMSAIDAHNAFSQLGLPLAFPCTDLCAGKRIYLTFPLFHTAGLCPLLAGAIYAEFTVVLGPFPPSAEIVDAVHIHGRVDQSTLAPPTIAEIAKNPEYLENISRLECISSGGGPVPKAVGDIIITKTKLFQGMGSTECGIFPVQIPEDPADWGYIHVSPYLGQDYRQVSGDLYEQVIVRRRDLEPIQGIFATFPELRVYPMKDLYSKHPTKENLWMYRGRTDDIIVYSTGEKLNPLQMEGMISAHLAVNAALVCGFGRFQSALLVEASNPPSSVMEKGTLLDTIWPSIRAANQTSPVYGQIHRNMVLFTTKDKPMLRAGKGTIQRRLTNELYAVELNALYGDDDARTSASEDGFAADISVVDAVRSAISATNKIDSILLEPTADLFQLGMDSLQVLAVVRRLNVFLRSRRSSKRVAARDVYSNPNVTKLTSIVAELLEGISSSAEDTLAPEERMKKIYERLASDLPISARSAHSGSSEKLTILLTGCNGSMGSYILHYLSKNPSVTQIYCLNRGNGKERQERSLKTKGLSLASPGKIQYINGDITKSRFGLSVEDYTLLLSKVTNVVMNAWQVDFNLALESFAGLLSNVRRFIDFSSHSAYNARLFFISSISSVGGHPNNRQSVSETMPADDDWSSPEPIGYGQSKIIAEKLLHAAAREAGIRATICRVGQVAGPTTDAGIWRRNEWLPSLLVSSKHLGKLPDALGRMEIVDWVPVDILGEVIDELATSDSATGSQSSGATVYHVANPKHTTWAKLLPAITQALQHDGHNVEVVPLNSWVKELQKSAPEAKLDDVSRNPALKLVDFFMSLIDSSSKQSLLETKHTVGISSALASSEPVSDELVEGWIKQLGL